MTRLEYGLVALIFVQITILFGVELYKPERSVATSKSQLLINIQSASVQEIAFDSEEVDLKLKKVNGKWLNDDVDSFPVDNDLVDNFLFKLTNLSRGLPVSVSTGSHERFKVSNMRFERKLVLTTESGEEVIVLFGKPATVRESYARVSKEDSVFAIGLEPWELGNSKDYWLDKKLFALDRADVKSVKVNDLKFVKTEGVFGLVESKELEYQQEKIDDFLDEIFDLRIESYISSEVEKNNLELFEIRMSVELNDSTRLDYLVEEEKDGATYRIRRTDKDGVYSVASYRMKKIMNINAEDLADVTASVDSQ